MKTALVAGATGLVGKQIVLELAAKDIYEKVIVLARRNLNYSHPKVDVKIISFDNMDNVQLEVQVDECFCALGTTQKKSGREGMTKVDYEYVLKLAQLCERHDIQKFLVVSSQGANANSGFFYMRTKGQMEIAVKKANINCIYLVRPSLITGERDEHRFAEEAGYYLYKAFSPFMVGRFKKLLPVSGLQIARCMIDLAQNNETGKFTIESDFIQTY